MTATIHPFTTRHYSPVTTLQDYLGQSFETAADATDRAFQAVQDELDKHQRLLVEIHNGLTELKGMVKLLCASED